MCVIILQITVEIMTAAYSKSSTTLESKAFIFKLQNTTKGTTSMYHILVIISIISTDQELNLAILSSLS